MENLSGRIFIYHVGSPGFHPPPTKRKWILKLFVESLLIHYFNLFLIMGSMDVGMCTWVKVCTKTRRGHQIPRNKSYRWLWAHSMGARNWASVLWKNHRVVSLAPRSLFLSPFLSWILWRMHVVWITTFSPSDRDRITSQVFPCPVTCRCCHLERHV